MSDLWLIESELYRDAAGTKPLPGFIGPFDTHEDAESWLDTQRPLWGSSGIAPIVAPYDASPADAQTGNE
jgi:hypothetical protein